MIIMKNSKLIIALALAAFTVLPLSAKKKSDLNLLPADIYGFENTKGVWWTKHKEIWTVSTEKAASGEASLKFSCNDLSQAADVKNIQMQGGNQKTGVGQISLSPGTYTITVKVWLSSEGAPKAFSSNIKSPFVSIPWKFKNVATEEWVTLTQEIVIEEEVKASKLTLAVSTNPKWGGAGTFYVDDICIKKN